MIADMQYSSNHQLCLQEVETYGKHWRYVRVVINVLKIN